MGRQRDPLAVFYDPTSEQFLAICIADLYGWHTLTVRSPAGDPIDARGLTRHERELQRSLWYTLNSTAAEGPQGGRWVKNPEHSLHIRRWDRPEYEGGVLARIFRTGARRRTLIARVTYGTNSLAFVDPADRYTENPDEQAQALQL